MAVHELLQHMGCVRTVCASGARGYLVYDLRHLSVYMYVCSILFPSVNVLNMCRYDRIDIEDHLEVGQAFSPWPCCLSVYL